MLPKFQAISKAWNGSVKAIVNFIRAKSFAQIYVDSKGDLAIWRNLVTLKARSVAYPSWPRDGMYRVCFVFVFPRPKRLGDGDREFMPMRKRRDLDNLEKPMLDAITDAELWEDDGLVVSKQSEKHYAATGEQPGVEVSIELLKKKQRQKTKSLFGDF